jgi:hypothetical protein
VPATMAEAERGTSTSAAADPGAGMMQEVERRPAARVSQQPVVSGNLGSTIGPGDII